MFVGIGDELHASDIYTGRYLWKQTVRKLGDFAACDDAVYAASGDSCVRLDASTGQQRAAYTAPAGGVWRPAEVDTSIRPGWFYHPEEDARLRTADDLVNLYFNSVGLNGKLLLNVPPTRASMW